MALASDGVEFQFSGTDDEALEAYVLEAEKILAQIDGVSETEVSISDKKSEVRIEINEARAALYGINTTYASTLVNQALSGATASRLRGKQLFSFLVMYIF